MLKGDVTTMEELRDPKCCDDNSAFLTVKQNA
jgi:hypothetical protein